MMRRGPLEQYAVEDILRSAATERLSGSIEVAGDVAGVLFFEGGGLYFATLDGVAVPADVLAPAATPERRLRHLVTVTAALLPQRRGWYHHHQLHQPLGRHPVWNRRAVPVAVVLAQAVGLVERHRSLEPWADGLLAVAGVDDPVQVDADGWAVVQAMAQPTSVYELAERLGWSSERVGVALGRLAADQLIDGEAGAPSTPAPSVAAVRTEGTADVEPPRASEPRRLVPSLAAAPALAMPAPVPLRAVEGDDDGRRFALRRLISSLRA